MRLIDADALHEALKTKQKWVVRCGDKHNEGYTYDQVHFAIDEAPTIEAVSIDDYRSMENTCYKLQKALYDMADRKTEPTISKMEQVDKDINVRSKDEPQTDGILFKGNLKEGDYKLIKTSNGWVLEGNDIAYYGEPQTERSSE